MKKRLYFDHAATRFPKPAIVLETMLEYSSTSEAAVGRGAYRASMRAGEIVTRLRREIAMWIDAESDHEISFHAGGTEALNAAILGLLRDGDDVVTTAAEHNSVLRPVNHLMRQGTVTWTEVNVDSSGQVDLGDVIASIKPKTRLVAIVHAANVNGAVQPVTQIGEFLRDNFPHDEKPLLLCDAAQTFGHLPISVNESAIDCLAAPGHKGGCGPLGTGFLYLNSRYHSAIRPTVFGGTGTRSESLDMPSDYPTGFEAGNMNVPALAGWLAGLQQRRQNGSPTDALQASAKKLKWVAGELYTRLDQIDTIRVVGRPIDPLLPVASIAIDGLPASDAAMILDGEFGIEVRSGLHCAALIHGAINSPPDGTLRISCCESTTGKELDVLADALGQVSGAS